MDKDADFYQSHKDDPEVWGDPEGVRGQKPERRRLNAMVSIRLTPEEEDAVRAEAQKRGISLSALVRQTILRELAPSSVVSIVDLLGTSTEAARSLPEMRPSSNVVVTSTADVHLNEMGA
jgi:hypothetical protein